MSQEVTEFCWNEIEDLLRKGIIRKSKSPWSCSAFYVQKNAELKRGAPRLVINYKPLNKVLEWIRYPISNKRDLINRLSGSVIFAKFDMKSGFWQIQIHVKDKYKKAFVTPFGQYEWNVMSFGLKNAPSELQNIMNDILSLLSKYYVIWKYSSLFLSFYKFLLSITIISEFWIRSNIFIFQDKMTPPFKTLSSTEKGKAKLAKLIQQAEFPPEIKNPECLTLAEKGKAKVNEYAEYPAEKLQKISQQIELLNLENPKRLTPAEIQQKIPKQVEFFNLEKSNSIRLEEVFQTSTKYSKGDLKNYPLHIQILLDNLTQAFLKSHKNFHDKSMKAIEYHLNSNKILLQSITSPNGQLAVKIVNRIRSPTEAYQIQRVNPKEKGKIRQRVLDLPDEIQNLIFTSPSYTEYFDKWIQRMMLITNGKDIEYKKVYGAKTLRVFEPHCEFPRLIYVPDKEYGLSRQLWNGDWEHYEIGCP
jgi:hypothetical protein